MFHYFFFFYFSFLSAQIDFQHAATVSLGLIRFSLKYSVDGVVLLTIRSTQHAFDGKKGM